VDDVPKHLSHDKRSTHSIFFPEENVRLPFKLKGVISYLDTRLPSFNEVNNCRWLIVTGDEDWDLYNDSFAENEDFTADETVPNSEMTRHGREICSTFTEETDIASKLYRSCSSISTVGRRLNATDKDIANIFGCSPSAAI